MPAEEVEFLSVGYAEVRDSVLDRIVGTGEGRREGALLVRGEWGSGKSHFLTYVRSLCNELGVAVSVVGLNARSLALNYPQRIYPALVENLEFGDRKGRAHRGLQSVITAGLEDQTGSRDLFEFARADETGDIGRAIGELLAEVADGGGPLGEHPAWATIMGDDLSWGVYGYQRTKALRRIGELSRLVRTQGSTCLVLLLDEVETIDQLWNVRSRMGAYSVLGHLCRTDGVLSVLATTARFDATIAADIDRGVLDDEKLSIYAEWFLRSARSGEFRVIDPPRFDRDSAETLAVRVMQLYESAHGGPLGEAQLARYRVDEWLKDPGGNPRTLIRSVVDALDCLRPLKLASE